jgi:butyryl-CoA dehydrogenase
MLGMAFFKSLVKHHGRRYFEPIGKVLAANKIRKPNFLNPAHLWKLKGPMWQYSQWLAGQRLHGVRADLPEMPRELRGHAAFAAHQLRKMAREISGAMVKHQLKLADRQCRMSELSARVQSLVVILCTSLYASRQTDELVRKAADGVCHTLTRQFTGARPSDRNLRDLTDLGAAIAADGKAFVGGVAPPPILMPYRQ